MLSLFHLQNQVKSVLLTLTCDLLLLQNLKELMFLNTILKPTFLNFITGLWDQIGPILDHLGTGFTLVLRMTQLGKFLSYHIF